jgi:uncharacterized protein
MRFKRIFDIMDFGWDQIKSDKNLRERGFGFDYAALVFAGPVIEKIDARFEYGETRIQALGAVGEEVLLVVFNDRENVRRIISARKANRKERRIWQSFVNR